MFQEFIDKLHETHLCESCSKDCKESGITGNLCWCPDYSKNIFIRF